MVRHDNTGLQAKQRKLKQMLDEKSNKPVIDQAPRSLYPRCRFLLLSPSFLESFKQANTP
jgi:hypothetical protein